MTQYIKESNVNLYNFFPSYYFSRSNSSIIVQHQETEIESKSKFFTIIRDCEFSNQLNIAFLGLNYAKFSVLSNQKQAQVLSMNSKITHQQLIFERNIVHNMSFVGHESILIRLDGYANIHTLENVFYEIGQLSNETIHMPVI